MSAQNHPAATLPPPAFWIEAGRAALGVLYPALCAGCGRPGPESGVPHLCEPCTSGLPRLTAPYCRVCGEWFVGKIDGDFRCSNCADRRFDFEFAFAPLRAEGAARELVHRLKYNKSLWLRVPLGHLMAEALRGPAAEARLETEPGWTLVPVPLHPRRLRERQFNQAAELCRIIRRLTGLPLREPLRRTRYTTVQTRLRGASASKTFAARSLSRGARNISPRSAGARSCSSTMSSRPARPRRNAPASSCATARRDASPSSPRCAADAYFGTGVCVSFFVVSGAAGSLPSGRIVTA